MALDITTQVEGMASFRKLIRKHGTAALSIKPHLAVVAQVADRSMALRCGRLVGLVATEQILARP